MATAVVGNGRAGGSGRVPPHDLEAEASVLGAILLDPLAIARVLDFLQPQDFYRENHGQVYQAALKLFREGEPIDSVTLAAELEKMGVLERVGGRAQLAMLQEAVPTAANVEHYARIVKDRAYKRQLVGAGARVMELGYDESIKAEEATDAAGREVMAIGQDQARGAVSAEVVVDELVQQLELIRSTGRGLVGIGSGLLDLDAITGGWKDGDLIVIGARPSAGKTALGLQMVMHAARQGTAATIFSLEMDRAALLWRAACSDAEVNSQRAREGHASAVEYDRVSQALDRLSRLPVMVDHRPELGDLGLVAEARRVKVREDTGLILVDYIGLVGGRRPDDRVQEVAAITRLLKRLARDLHLPVIALAQLNRGPEKRGEARPVLSDFKESGEIEQAADVAVLIHHDKESPEVTELIVAKHRNGRTGSVKVRFNRERVRFETLEQRRAQGSSS
jgi:replicative DNA helicase